MSARTDGFRLLVDRLWPRGVSKADAQIDLWDKDFAPSNRLRQWFHADPEKRFSEFSRKYAAELRANKTVLLAKWPRKKVVTLITAVKDVEHSHIPTLQKFLHNLK